MDHIAKRVWEVGADTHYGAFLYASKTRGLLNSLFLKALFFFLPRRTKLRIAQHQVSLNSNTYLSMIVEDERSQLIALMDILCTYTFVLGTSSEAGNLAMLKFKDVLRKARWQRGINNEDSPLLDELLSAFNLTPEEFEERYQS